MSSIELHLDNLTLRRAHLRLGLAAGLGVFLDGYDMSMMAIAIVFIRPAWHLSASWLGLLAASTLAGAMIGGVIGGRFADVYGRKWMYLIDIATFFFAALFSAFAWNVQSLIALRFLLGVGIGIDYPLSATFLAEFAPRKSRGTMMTWSFALLSIGGISAFVVGYLLSLLGPESWRLLFASGAVPAMGLLLLRRTLPESPRWHLRNNDPRSAAKELRRFNPDYACDETTVDALPGEYRVAPRAKWHVLFSRRFIRRTMLVAIPWLLMDVVDYGFNIYIPTLLLSLGMKTFGGTVLASVVLGLIGFTSFVLVASSIDRFGRIRPQILGFVGMGVGMAALAVLAMQAKPPILIVCVCILFMKLSNAFPDITTWVLPVELFPTELRASAHGFGTSFSRLGAATSVFLFPILREAWGTSLVLFLIAAAQIIAALVTAVLAFEPARRSLEEIAAA